jgi:hypothetical protein
MPIESLRSCEQQFETILKHVRVRRLVAEIQAADKGFHYRYFKGYRPEKIGKGRIRKIAQKEVFSGDGHELFANLLIIHWNEAERDLYQEMLTHVQAINEDVEAIEKIEDANAHVIIDDLLERHGMDNIYVCVRLNGVRFGEAVIESRLVKGEPAGATAPASAAVVEDTAD